MSNLPASTSRKFAPSDYKTAPAWFTGRFLSQLNLFTDPVYAALSNGLSFFQNFNCQYFTQIITAGAAPTDNKFSFKSTVRGTPFEVILASCNVASDPTIALASVVGFSWYFSAGVIYITAVSGLTASTVYSLTVRAA
jgi:hypothetical protein